MIDVSIASLQRRYATNAISCVDVVRWHLDRIAELDRQGPCLTSVIRTLDGALDRAAALDASNERGPLHGVPIALKDNIDVAGVPTTGGCAALDRLVPAAGAEVVHRLEAAGAVLIAKTAMTELAWGMADCVGSAFPAPTRNPYSLQHASGGSSGGSAVAVSANLAVVALGTDTGCSVRAPASICGIVGLRPTHGLVPTAGMMPMNADWDTVGPMARTVADSRVVLEVLAPLPPANPVTFRVGVPRQLVDPEDADPAVLDVLSAALDALREAGFGVLDPAPIEQLPDFDVGFWYRRFRHDLDAYLRAHGDRSPHPDLASVVASGQVHPRHRELLERFQAFDLPSDSERMTHQARKDELRSHFLACLDNYDLDALVFPTFLRAPRRNGDLESPVGNNNAWASECSFPALTVPMGFTPAGLPVGLQWMGRPHDEGRLLAAAECFERATVHRRPPDL